MTTLETLIWQRPNKSRRKFLYELCYYSDLDDFDNIEKVIRKYYSELDVEVIESMISFITPKLLQIMLELVNTTKPQLDRLFVVAVLTSDIPIIRMLLELGVDPNTEISDDLYHSVNYFDNNNYYQLHQTRGYLLYRVINGLEYDKLKLLIEHGVDLNIENGIVITELYSALGWNESEANIKKFVEIYELILLNYEPSQHNIILSYARAIQYGNTIYANLLKKRVPSGQSTYILSSIFQSKGCFYNYHVIVYCLDNFDFSEARDILDTIAQSVGLLLGGEIIDLLPKLHKHGANLQNHAVNYMITALHNKNTELVRELRNYIDVNKCIRDITDKILE